MGSDARLFRAAATEDVNVGNGLTVTIRRLDRVDVFDLPEVWPLFDHFRYIVAKGRFEKGEQTESQRKLDEHYIQTHEAKLQKLETERDQVWGELIERASVGPKVWRRYECQMSDDEELGEDEIFLDQIPQLGQMTLAARIRDLMIGMPADGLEEMRERIARFPEADGHGEDAPDGGEAAGDEPGGDAGDTGTTAVELGHGA